MDKWKGWKNLLIYLKWIGSAGIEAIAKSLQKSSSQKQYLFHIRLEYPLDRVDPFGADIGILQETYANITASLAN